VEVLVHLQFKLMDQMAAILFFPRLHRLEAAEAAEVEAAQMVNQD